MAMAMGRGSSGLAYPERFYAAASYAGFDGSPDISKGVASKFSNDVALLLYALFQQATVGPCNVSKPRGWDPVEQSKWTSWHRLGSMAHTEAMQLFVKILEEEDPSWYTRASVSEPTVDLEMNHTSNVDQVVENGHTIPDKKTIASESAIADEIEDKDVISNGPGSIAVYDKWVAPPVSGLRPNARYEHGAAVIQDKMYVYGGNHNGRYLSDLHVLDLKSWTWSRVNAKYESDASESQNPGLANPRAGHTLISWDNKLLSIAGHTKDLSETILVKEFDPLTNTWSSLKTFGKPPISRGGQSVTLVGTTLVIFGGEDAKRSLLNDLHILDLESMTWDEFEAVGTPPSPRADHAAAVHAERYLLIFGGGSHATCFSDLHVLDLQTMEWSRPTQQGEIPAPRAGHAGVTIGDNWFIVGGGNNTSGVSETAVLSMSTLVWSVITATKGRVPVASEGLSLVVSSCDSEDVLVSFGGYNGHYINEVNVLKPSHKLQSNIEVPIPDGVSAVHNATNATRDLKSDLKVRQGGKVREIAVDNLVSDPKLREKGEGGSRYLWTNLESEKEQLESLLSKERMLSLQLKQELSDAENRHSDLYKELQSIRGQLAAEQSRCFKLEVDVAELRQKLQAFDTLQKEFELLQRQKAASEQAALDSRRQDSGGMWTWITGTPQSRKEEYDDDDET